MKIINNEIKAGDIYKGIINNAIIKVLKVEENKGNIIYLANNKEFMYGLEAFKRCNLVKVN